MIQKLKDKLQKAGLTVRMFTPTSLDSDEGRGMLRKLQELEARYKKGLDNVSKTRQEPSTAPVKSDTPKSECAEVEDSRDMPLTVPVKSNTPKSECTDVNESDAKIQNTLDNLIMHYEKYPNYAKGFVTDVADTLGFSSRSASRYKTFALPTGQYLTIRLCKHNANVKNFDKNEEMEALSIVVSPFRNRGLTARDSKAHVVEYYYSKKNLESVTENKPLAEILKSLREALHTGVFVERTGLAERQEVNVEQMMMQIIPQVQPVFLSNAMAALQNIRQEKATPQQWLAMLQKAGGIKTGEDRWTGLSQWLTDSKEKSLARQDVQAYMLENAIHVEDTLYVDAFTSKGLLTNLQAEFDEYVAEGEEKTGSLFYSDHYKYAYSQMQELYGRDFYEGFNVDENGKLYIYRAEPATQVLKVHPINEDRLIYTTDYLNNKSELALVVPDIDAYNREDSIHFGDAGEGRCVGWIRFGDIDEIYFYTNRQRQEMIEAMPGADQWIHQVYDRGYVPEVWYPPVKDANCPDANISITNGYYRIWGVKDMMHTSFPTLDEAVMAYNRHVVPKEKVSRILVMDEIQSKRHQDGKKYGYMPKGVVAEYDRLMNISEETINSYYDRLREVRKEQGWKGVVDEKTEALWRSQDTDLGERYQEMKMANWKATMYKRMHSELESMGKEGGKIPAAPFEKNWHELCMKRMLRYAAENGYDALTWTTGEQQAVRYDLGQVVNAIASEPYEAQSANEIDGYDIDLHTNIGKLVLFVDKQGKVCSGNANGMDLTGTMLEKLIGKPMTERILSSDGPLEIRSNEAEFRFGFDGMKKFYDEMLPSFMNKYGKRWGVQVETFLLTALEPREAVKHGIRITPEMRESVMQGQPMFMRGSEGELYGFTVGDTIWLTEKGLRPETLVHEYTHVWAAAMMQGNPDGWQSVKDLLKDTPLWQVVRKDAHYSYIKDNEDLLASEVLARISGKDNADRLEHMLHQSEGRLDDTLMDQILDRIRRALETFWSWVGKHMFDIDKFNSVEEVTDRVLYDLLNAKQLEQGKVFHQTATTGNDRITHIHVFKGRGGEPYIRCKIDGQQQMGVPVKPQDGQVSYAPQQLQVLAQQYFAKALQTNEETRSIKR